MQDIGGCKKGGGKATKKQAFIMADQKVQNM